jgi:hypothetical protein
VIRAAVLCLAFAAVSPAWVESVEFPWNAYPRPLWERELVWLKNIGITHVSLPPAKDPAELTDVIRIIRPISRALCLRRWNRSRPRMVDR